MNGLLISESNVNFTHFGDVHPLGKRALYIAVGKFPL